MLRRIFRSRAPDPAHPGSALDRGVVNMGAMSNGIGIPSASGDHSEPSDRRSSQQKNPGPALVLLMICVMVLALGCGLIGGGDDEAEGEPGDDIRAEIQAELDAEAGESSEAGPDADDPDSEEAGASGESETETQAAEAAPPAEVPAAATGEASPVGTPVVENEEQARNLAWAHISQCITFNAAELKATLITNNWFVNGTDQASREYGFWKIPSATAKVTPHDTQARKWESAIASQCSAESLESVPIQSRVVSDAAGAGTAVWSYLIQCIPALSTEGFQSVYDPAKGQWAVVISPGQTSELGTWVVNPDTGAVTPHTEPARLWDSAVRLGCTAEVVDPLLQPTAAPPPTPVVVEISAAVTNLWSYLVKCESNLTEANLQATWNPVTKEWIVITAPGLEVDYGVWTVRPDGSISPSNLEASRRDQLSIGGTC